MHQQAVHFSLRERISQVSLYKVVSERSEIVQLFCTHLLPLEVGPLYSI